MQVIKVKINRHEPNRIGWKYNSGNGLLIAWNNTEMEDILEKKGLYCGDIIIEYDEKCRVTVYKIDENLEICKLEVSHLN